MNCPLQILIKEYYFFYSYYVVSKNDPELMLVPKNCDDTIAKYHFHYLHEMLRYKKIRYNKNKPNVVADVTYFNGLIRRIHSTNHIKSFEEFVRFIENENRIC